MPRRIERRPQIPRAERGLLLGREQARVPRLPRHRLVLHAHAAHAHALVRIRAHVTREQTRPRLVVRAAQMAAAVHHTVALHERRRAPRRGQQLERGVRGQAALDEREQQPLIARERERAQRPIERPHVGVVPQRKIAALNVGAAQRVRVAARRGIAEAQRDEPILFVGWHLREHVRAGLGERAAEPADALVRAVGAAHHQLHLRALVAPETHLAAAEGAAFVRDPPAHGNLR